MVYYGVNLQLLSIFLWIFLATLVFLLYKSFQSNRVRLLNGILLTLCLTLFIVVLTLTAYCFRDDSLLYAIVSIEAILIAGLVLFSSISGILLLWNAWVVWRRESHSLGNTLTLLLGVFIVFTPAVFSLLNNIFPIWIVKGLRLTVGTLCAYFGFWLGTFVMSFLLYKCFKPRHNKQYIIVLGAGLLDGNKVSPLLKSRIDVAIKFAKKQYDKIGDYPLLIMSGGQGGDETIPEGRAMKEYALQQDYPEELVESEEQSKTTYQNMLFSKKLIEKYNKIDEQDGIFATSDYHVFRAAGYARLVGLNIDGIGANTSHYFVYNAYLREYVAILANHKKFHIYFLSIILLIDIILTLLLGYSLNWK